MANRFISFLEAVGRDFGKGLLRISPYAEQAGALAIGIFAPALSPLFGQVVAAVVTAEQSAAAAGKQSKTGPAKLASVVQLMGPLIAQALGDLGRPNDSAAVEGYVSAVVAVLNGHSSSTTAGVVNGAS
jgi:hypothetical protein